MKGDNLMEDKDIIRVPNESSDNDNGLENEFLSNYTSSGNNDDTGYFPPRNNEIWNKKKVPAKNEKFYHRRN